MKPQFSQTRTIDGIDICVSGDSNPLLELFTESFDSPITVNVDESHLGQGLFTCFVLSAFVISLYLSGYIFYPMFVTLNDGPKRTPPLNLDKATALPGVRLRPLVGQ